ncbi:hypothetical protein [Streptomyces sp. GbtcB7]|uniref:hypothetical protein n=1 Tax=Streptomyces sp. GbtcB7 TaxID=2824752 RepID=UPI001C30EB21|nr:hypothetical protein [Streptomyces sp. GbtcB7]
MFAAAREVPAAAGRAEVLLAFLGRDPHRTPAVSWRADREAGTTAAFSTGGRRHRPESVRLRDR